MRGWSNDSNQNYSFTARVSVPAGRIFQLCAQIGDCAGTKKCIAGSGDIQVATSVPGICGISDDPYFRLSVTATDGKAGCGSYSLAARYD